MEPDRNPEVASSRNLQGDSPKGGVPPSQERAIELLVADLSLEQKSVLHYLFRSGAIARQSPQGLQDVLKFLAEQCRVREPDPDLWGLIDRGLVAKARAPNSDYQQVTLGAEGARMAEWLERDLAERQWISYLRFNRRIGFGM